MREYLRTLETEIELVENGQSIRHTNLAIVGELTQWSESIEHERTMSKVVSAL